MSTRRPVHFLHISKAGGTAIKAALKPFAEERSIILHPHATGLAQVPKGERTFFIVRDPVTRFVSGFNSRLRKGRPRLDVRWNDAEMRVFTQFITPNDLAESLRSKDSRLQGEAEFAMRSIRHVNQPLRDWLPSAEYLRSRLPEIMWIGRQETLDDDFDQIKRRLGLPRDLAFSSDKTATHATPKHFSVELSKEGRANIERWYATDIRLHNFVLRMRAQIAKRSRVAIAERA